MKTEQKSKHGGARLGAGRKPKLQYEARELFCSAVDARWDTIMSKLDKLITSGDFKALRWVLEQRIGKAPQSLDITSQGEKISPELQKSREGLGEIIETVDEVLSLVMVDGMSHHEAAKQFREWHRATSLNSP